MQDIRNPGSKKDSCLGLHGEKQKKNWVCDPRQGFRLALRCEAGHLCFTYPPNTHTLTWVTPFPHPTLIWVTPHTHTHLGDPNPVTHSSITAAEASRHIDCPLKRGCSSTDTNDEAHEDHASITVRTRYCHQEQSGTL